MNELNQLRDALAELDARLRECFGSPINAEDAYDSFYQEIVAAALSSAPPVPAAAPAGEPRVTEEMITAYLTANDAYWKRIDGEPTKLGKWRNGTPSEATRISLEAALATLPASPEPTTQGAAKPVHTDHPFQHWDRTCPACVLEASPPVPNSATQGAAEPSDDWLDDAYERLCRSCQGAGEVAPTLPTFVRGLIGMLAPTMGAASPAPEPLTPAAGVSEPPICPHCSKPAFAWPESAIRRGRHVVGGVVVYHCREAAVDD